MLDEIAATPIGDIENREPVRIKPDTPLRDVVTSLTEGNRGAAIVEDDKGCLLGIFTERHLMSDLDHSSLGWHDTLVQDVMDEDPPTIMASDDIRQTLAMMTEDKIRHLPIVDSNNRVTGVTSIRDILVHITGYFPEEFLNLPPDPDHEATDQWGG